MDLTVTKPKSTDSATLPDFKSYLGYDVSGTATSQANRLTISGCSASTGMDGEYYMVETDSTRIRLSLNKASPASGNAVITAAEDTAICSGNTVTFSTRMGSLLDSSSIAVGDRLKVHKSTTDYETRTVDKIWGSNLDVTMFSVQTAFTTNSLQDLVAWVDESGSTEKLECSRRGACGDDGVCECYAGYTGDACSIQNALAS